MPPNILDREKWTRKQVIYKSLQSNCHLFKEKNEEKGYFLLVLFSAQ